VEGKFVLQACANKAKYVVAARKFVFDIKIDESDSSPFRTLIRSRPWGSLGLLLISLACEGSGSTSFSFVTRKAITVNAPFSPANGQAGPCNMRRDAAFINRRLKQESVNLPSSVQLPDRKRDKVIENSGGDFLAFQFHCSIRGEFVVTDTVARQRQGIDFVVSPALKGIELTWQYSPLIQPFG
jgi:hypothetical protein